MVLALCLAAAAQTPYQPKFKGDPAKSDSEAAALGYMRTVIRAQKIYQKKNNKFAASLADLVHTGSFTKRMVNPDRGDYSVGFRPQQGRLRAHSDAQATGRRAPLVLCRRRRPRSTPTTRARRTRNRRW